MKGLRKAKRGGRLGISFASFGREGLAPVKIEAFAEGIGMNPGAIKVSPLICLFSGLSQMHYCC